MSRYELYKELVNSMDFSCDDVEAYSEHLANAMAFDEGITHQEYADLIITMQCNYKDYVWKNGKEN